MKLTSSYLKPNTKVSDVEKRGQQMALKLFHEASKRVPAYKDFLKKESINPSAIRTIEDFRHVPLVDKKNYLTKYSMEELSWDGNIFENRIISVSSGSTGDPFFWPRGKAQDVEGGWMHERLYRGVFDMHNTSTLVVVCFSMGTWIAGSFTSASTMQAAENGMKLNIITPGIEKEEALKVIKNLGPHYDQVVLAGYPPFTKDIIDLGPEWGINWKKLRVRLLWAGEAFSEEWREHVLKKVNSKDPYHDSINIYGSADAAMLGHETPLSIALRKIYNKKTKLMAEIFDSEILPSIAQYYPDRRYFEAVDGELVFTAHSGIPLVRYNIHDTGGVSTYDYLTEPISEQLIQTIKAENIDETYWRLPFVYLKGRKDLTATIYAVNIYPENIKAALVDPKVSGWVTGKFTMATKYKSDMDQYFEINVELAKGIKGGVDYKQIAEKVIFSKLMRLNAEFHKLHSAIGDKALPIINLINYGNTDYFANGVKHRWVKNS